ARCMAPALPLCPTRRSSDLVGLRRRPEHALELHREGRDGPVGRRFPDRRGGAQVPARQRGPRLRGEVKEGLVIRRFAPPRPAKDAEHAVVHRRDDQFCAWPYTMGFWETASGELVANFLSLDTDYADRAKVSHDHLAERGGGRSRLVTVRSADRGRTWGEPRYDAYPRPNPQTAPADLSAWGPFDFLDRDVLVGNSSTDFGTPKS